MTKEQFLDDACEIIKLIGFNNCKYMASGYYGHAFDVGNKVVKLTSEEEEYLSVKEHVVGKKIDGLVHYYDAFPIYDIPNFTKDFIKDYRYGVNKWVLIMDKVIPLDERSKSLLSWAINSFYIGMKRDDVTNNDWDDLLEFETYSEYFKHYPNLVHSPAYDHVVESGMVAGHSKEDFKRATKLYYLYAKAAKKLTEQGIIHNDGHSGNVGWDPYGNLVFFDYS